MTLYVPHQQRRGVALPPGVRSVARPSRWGNPYRVEWSAQRRLWLVDDRGGCWPSGWPSKDYAAEWAVEMFERNVLSNLDLSPLYGAAGIACYCPLDAPCHRDSIIRRLHEEAPDAR